MLLLTIMRQLLIVLFVFICSELSAAPGYVYVEKAPTGYELRVSAPDEQFKVVFPEEPKQIGEGKDGQIIYELDKEGPLSVRYLFAYVYDPAARGYPMRLTYRYPSVGANRLETMRKEVVDRVISRLLALSGTGSQVVAKEIKHELYPPRHGTQGSMYEYEVLIVPRIGSPAEVVLRLYFGREGIYIVAMIGSDIGSHMHEMSDDYKGVFADFRWRIPYLALDRRAPFLRFERSSWRLIPYLWPEKSTWRRLRGMMWGNFGPEPFFNSAEIIFKEG
jgi:hypothetical protein